MHFILLERTFDLPRHAHAFLRPARLVWIGSPPEEQARDNELHCDPSPPELSDQSSLIGCSLRPPQLRLCYPFQLQPQCLHAAEHSGELQTRSGRKGKGGQIRHWSKDMSAERIYSRGLLNYHTFLMLPQTPTASSVNPWLPTCSHFKHDNLGSLGFRLWCSTWPSGVSITQEGLRGHINTKNILCSVWSSFQYKGLVVKLATICNMQHVVRLQQFTWYVIVRL